MSREFLVWFEPVAEGLWGACGISVLVLLFAAMFCILTLDLGEHQMSDESVARHRRRVRWCVITVALLGLCMVAINPFTDGPKLYDEAHKTPQQAEKE